MRPIALSTMYFQHWRDPTDLPGFAAAAEGLGYDGLELGHVVTSPALARLAPGAARVFAVHHPCPAVPGGPSAVELLAPDPVSSRAAAEALLASIETADRFGARFVVLHLGRATGDGGDRARRLAFEVASRYRAGQAGTRRYEEAARDVRALVADLDEGHVERAASALAGPLSAARARGICLAIETPYHVDELPRPAGMRRLLTDLGAYGAAAWLDTGHVGAQVHQGLCAFEEWFEAVGDAWAGVHLHDAVGLRDHLVPGMGDLDLRRVVASLPHDAIVTCEIDWYFSPDEVRQGRSEVARILA